MSNLLEAIRLIFPPVLSSHLAARMGESAPAMKRALKGAVPILLSGMAARAAADAGQLLALCQQVQQTGQTGQAGVTSILATLGSKDAPGSAMLQGRRLLASFGSLEQVLVQALGQYAHVRPAVARELLELVGAVLLGALGEHFVQQQLNADKVAMLLSGLQNRIKASLPHGLDNLTAVVDLRAQPRWQVRLIPTSYRVLRRVLGQHGWAQWYAVASVVLGMTGAGLVAVEALRTEPTVQVPTQASAPRAVIAVEAVVAERVAPARASL